MLRFQSQKARQGDTDYEQYNSHLAESPEVRERPNCEIAFTATNAYDIERSKTFPNMDLKCYLGSLSNVPKRIRKERL